MAYSVEEIEKAFDAQKTALQSSADVEKAQYQQNIDTAGQTYQPLRNTAYVDNQLAEIRRKEAMANMGLSGAGGTSRTLEQRNTSTLQNNLGNIGLQEQAYVNQQKLSLQEVDAAFSQALADIETSRASALTTQSNWQQEYDAAQSAQKWNEAWTMLQSGRITPAQFQQITGQSVKGVSNGSSGSSGPPSDYSALQKYYWYRNNGASEQEASIITGYTPLTGNDALRTYSSELISALT